MTEPDNSSIDNDAEPEGTAPELAVLDDTLPDQAVTSNNNAPIENQSTPGITPTRMSMLHLPPEIRVIIYHYVLQLPFHIPYDNPRVWNHPVVQAHTGLLFTSRLIQREGLLAFFSENTFVFQQRFSRFSVIPSLRIRNMIQNFSTHIDIPLPSAPQRRRERFREMMRTVEDPDIIRGTFFVHFSLDPVYHRHSARLNFFLRHLRRLTNFQVVMVDFIYRASPARSTARHRDHVENALRSALGPATPYTTTTQRQGLTFHPQRFVNARPRRESVDLTLRLAESEGETPADQNADESARNPSS